MFKCFMEDMSICNNLIVDVCTRKEGKKDSSALTTIFVQFHFWYWVTKFLNISD